MNLSTISKLQLQKRGGHLHLFSQIFAKLKNTKEIFTVILIHMWPSEHKLSFCRCQLSVSSILCWMKIRLLNFILKVRGIGNTVYYKLKGYRVKALSKTQCVCKSNMGVSRFVWFHNNIVIIDACEWPLINHAKLFIINLKAILSQNVFYRSHFKPYMSQVIVFMSAVMNEFLHANLQLSKKQTWLTSIKTELFVQTFCSEGHVWLKTAEKRRLNDWRIAKIVKESVKLQMTNSVNQGYLFQDVQCALYNRHHWNFIHRMQIWQTTRSVPGTSCMKVRLVMPRCFVLTIFPWKILLRGRSSLFYFAMPTSFWVPECH